MPRTPREHDEASFQNALDDAAGDVALRWLFADWLAQRGDWRAPGYLWMAQQHKLPELDRTHLEVGHTWDWWSMLPGWSNRPQPVRERFDRLPPPLMDALDGHAYKSDWSGNCAYCEFYTRRDAEEALCRALLAAPPLTPQAR